ncbi:ECF transporter S component [Clostridia bacterium]|nr:ECF transporter S component [Clostridia bacterium]
MRDKRVERLVLTAVMIGLTTVATMVITIPVVGTQGFVNFGDVVIFVTSILFGPHVGLLAGGLGSSLGDILLGYAHWAPYTLVIKGLEGLVAGWLSYRMFSGGGIKCIRGVLGLIAASFVMIAGYYVGGGILFGFTVSLLSIPQNAFQVLLSAAIAIPLALALSKVKMDILK